MNFKNSAFLLLLLIFMGSCTSYKQTAYFQDAKIESNNTNTPTSDSATDSQIKIQSYDVLDITIGSSKQGFDKLFQSQSFDALANVAGGGSKAGASTSPNYYTGFLVDVGGNVNLPILGNVKVMGLSIAEAKELINKKAKDYLTEPYVEIKFLSFRIQVLGQVKLPGIVTIQNEKASILDVIAAVGDVTDFGDPKNVLVIRGSGTNQKIYNVDLTSMSTFKSPVFQIKPNDMVVVHPQKRKFFSANITTFIPLLTAVNVLLTVVNFLKR